eukprot:170671-Rhodomonas_salina.1
MQRLEGTAVERLQQLHTSLAKIRVMPLVSVAFWRWGCALPDFLTCRVVRAGKMERVASLEMQAVAELETAQVRGPSPGVMLPLDLPFAPEISCKTPHLGLLLRSL